MTHMCSTDAKLCSTEATMQCASQEQPCGLDHLLAQTRGGRQGTYAETRSSQNNVALCVCNAVNIARFCRLSPLQFVLEPLDVREVVTLDDSGELRFKLVIVDDLGC